MALTAAEMSEQVQRWAAMKGVNLHPGCEQILQNTFINEAEPQIRARLASGVPADQVSREVDRQLLRLLEEILQASPINELHEAATGAAFSKLCPGFWPFC